MFIYMRQYKGIWDRFCALDNVHDYRAVLFLLSRGHSVSLCGVGVLWNFLCSTEHHSVAESIRPTSNKKTRPSWYSRPVSVCHGLLFPFSIAKEILWHAEEGLLSHGCRQCWQCLSTMQKKEATVFQYLRFTVPYFKCTAGFLNNTPLFACSSRNFQSLSFCVCFHRR